MSDYFVIVGSEERTHLRDRLCNWWGEAMSNFRMGLLTKMPFAEEAAEIAEQLEQWLADEYRAYRILKQSKDTFEPPVSLTLCTNSVVELSVGDISVWDNQGYGEDDLTFYKCRERYIDEVKKLAAILGDR